MTFVPGICESYARESFRIRGPFRGAQSMMVSHLCWMVVAVLASGLTQDSTNSAGVVAPGAKLEKLWGEGSFTEGGALAGDGSILFSDIGDRIMRFDPATGKTTVFREPSGRANGLIFDPKGRLIAAEGANTGGGPADLDHRTRRHGSHAGRPLPGQAVQQPQRRRRRSPGARLLLRPPLRRRRAPRARLRGRLPHRPRRHGHPAGDDGRKPNGLAVSPDGKTLYVADNGRQRRALLALDLDPERRRLASARAPRLRRQPGHRRHDRHDRRPDRRRRRLRRPAAAPTSSPRTARSWRSSPPRNPPPTSSSAAPTARPSTSPPARASTASAPR